MADHEKSLPSDRSSPHLNTESLLELAPHPAAVGVLSRASGSLGNPTLTFDEHGSLSGANADAERLFAFGSGKLTGSKIADLFPRSEREMDGVEIADCWHGGHRLPNSVSGVVARRADGMLFDVDVVLSALSISGKRTLIVLVQEVHHRARADQSARQRRKQQNFLAELGLQALSTKDFPTLVQHVVTAIASSLEVEFCGLFRILSDESTLLLEAGTGWQPGCIGRVFSSRTLDLSDGFNAAFEPQAITGDTESSSRMGLLRQHSIVSGMSVLIHDSNRPYGTLSVHSAKPRKFVHEDIQFLECVAHILANSFERFQSQEALRLSEERARLVLDNLFCLVFVMSPDGTLLDTNRALLKAAATPTLEVRGKKLWDCPWWNYSSDVQEQLHTAIHFAGEGAVSRYDTQLRMGRGRTLPIDFMIAPIRDSSGRITHLIGSGVDISERLAANAALRESEEQYRATFELAAAGMVELEPRTGRFVRVNKKFCQVTGYTARELRGKRFFDLALQEDRHPEWERFQNALQSGMRSFRSELRCARKDEAVVWVRVNAAILRDTTGESVRCVGVVEDITGRRRAEEALRRQARLLELSHDAIFIRREGGGIEFWNRGAAKLYGYNPSEAIGRIPGELLRTRVLTRPDDLESALKAHGVWEGEFVQHAKDGREVIVLARLQLVPDGTSKLILESSRDITESKRAEEALRRSEELFHSAADHIPSVFVIYNPERRFQYVNARGLRLANLTLADMVGRRDEELFPPEVRDGYLPVLQRAIDTATMQTEECSARLPGTDNVVTFVVSCIPLLNPEGKLREVVVITHDVTDRKKAEEALKTERNFVSAILDTVGALVAVFDRVGTIVRFNKTCEQVTGYSSEEVCGKHNWQLLIPDDEEEGVRNALGPVMAGAHPIRYENHWVTRTGERRLISWSNAVLHGDDGRVEYLISTGIDITERRRIELERGELLTRFEATFQNAAVGISHIDRSGRWLRLNQKLCQIAGYSSEELLGRRFSDITHPDDVAEDWVQMRRLIAGEVPSYSLQKRYIRKNGDVVWVNVTVSFIRNENPDADYFIRVVEDVTDRKELEKEVLEISNREQRRIGQDLHDDLCQLLAGVELLSYTLAEQLAPISPGNAAQAEKIASHIRDAIRRARMLARGLAPISIQSDGLPAALLELAQMAEQMFRVRCTCTCSRRILVRDPEAALHLYRIVQEAISNAVRHGQATEIQICLSLKKTRAVLLISNNGKPISQPLPERAGMGLRIMQYRAQMAGGTLDVSVGEQGRTEVSCIFPNNL